MTSFISPYIILMRMIIASKLLKTLWFPPLISFPPKADLAPPRSPSVRKPGLVGVGPAAAVASVDDCFINYPRKCDGGEGGSAAGKAQVMNTRIDGMVIRRSGLLGRYIGFMHITRFLRSVIYG